MVLVTRNFSFQIKHLFRAGHLGIFQGFRPYSDQPEGQPLRLMRANHPTGHLLHFGYAARQGSEGDSGMIEVSRAA